VIKNLKNNKVSHNETKILLSETLMEKSGYNIRNQDTGLSPWLLNNSWAYSNLIRFFMKNISSLGHPQFLHKTSLLELINRSPRGVVGAVPKNGQLGKLNLRKTFLMSKANDSGFVVIVLDPLSQLSDFNRTDNVFVQFVRLGNHSISANGQRVGKRSLTCSASAINSGILHVSYAQKIFIYLLKWQ